MKSILKWLTLAFLTSISLSSTSEEVITIYGSDLSFAPSEWTVVCSGIGCKNSADNVQNAIVNMLRNAADEYVEEEEIRDSFCSALRATKPSHCEGMFGSSMTWPYLTDSSAFWNIPSATNGCGTGGIIETAINAFLKGRNGYTGDPDQPLDGYSFESACNNHDICYNGGSGQMGCDMAFYDSMLDVCKGDYQCNTYAKGYSAAVEMVGDDAYDKATLTQACREYKNDLKNNACDKAISGGMGST
ncbi:hypothetical protein LP316_03405 [Thalassotalea sp. LPB0316]|uniref:hypothetical protein n=1 Tax=Thalassotalea sp. LPB0316 TaxID=2769490 RepID=UPI001866F6A3|nr:hypothetical protein [Thalassotalea sp. LPB0316]QOL26365.1 hypothetical protein LP316_03405 [Thalassotalea sp. LPB0316]